MDRAPWWGGFFERLIQNTKRCLRKTLRNAKLNYDELHTVLVEVEGTLNSRPLTYVSSDDPEEPLTPSHLMYGRRILSLPEVTGNGQASLDHTVSSEDLPRRRKYLGLLLEHFWRHWNREYVTDLRNLHRQNPGLDLVLLYLMEKVLTFSKTICPVFSGNLDEYSS